ncbi:DUF2145 domain-containing protein [Luteimonas aestuarii]|uniref:DUF2145 domain-containing protein n=1 Tax=Luteimonas aestuarii TaxID=453837 RepID=UPI001404E24D|nr:DUF2145 domain-containing protein [Luteimonas aestuarii]
MNRETFCLCLVLLLWPVHAFAGANCEATAVPAHKVAAAASTALRTVDALDARNAPVALVARVGRDLSEHGLVYSHAGFAVRDHPAGRWTVVHLLNECGSARAGLYAQGLVNFFSDDLVNQDARITWLAPAHAQRLALHLLAVESNPLFQPKYNLIARPGSREYQNSTAWVLETLAATLPTTGTVRDRQRAHALAVQAGFRPDTIRIPYAQRVLGGLFGSNVAFTDHGISTRLSGEYPVVTVRSILRWVASNDPQSTQMEWRGGVLMAEPGPG